MMTHRVLGVGVGGIWSDLKWQVQKYQLEKGDNVLMEQWQFILWNSQEGLCYVCEGEKILKAGKKEQEPYVLKLTLTSGKWSFTVM